MNSWAYKTMIYYWLVYNNNLENKMPFKIRLINDFKKCLQESRDNSEEQIEKQGSFENMNEGKQKSHNGKKITKKNYNIYQIDLKMNPTQSRHIANFYNIIGINEEAVRSNDCPDSYFRTLFYLKSVKKIESRPNYLLLHLVDGSLPFPPIQYIIERFKSFGDQRFFNIAQLIIEVTLRLNAIQKIKTHSEKEEANDFLEKYTQSLGNRMFVCRISRNKMLISKSLLQQLEYDPEEIIFQTLRFRTPTYEAASSEMYYDVIVKYLQNLINLLDLVCDKISLETFLDTSIMRFRDCLYTKHHKKLHCKIKTGMPNPPITIFEVQEIVNRSQEIQPNMFYRCRQDELIKRAQERIQKKQIGSVLSLMNLPKSFLPENQSRVPLYKDIEAHEMQRNMV